MGQDDGADLQGAVRQAAAGVNRKEAYNHAEETDETVQASRMPEADGWDVLH